MSEAPSEWLEAGADPFRESLLGAGEDLPERVAGCAEPVRDEPAFDPERIARLADAVRLPEGVRFGHPLLERVVRVGLAHVEATFVGDHPRYGTGNYANAQHDGFPPVIIAAVDALTLWGDAARAEALLAYWLENFVREDGTLDYYGPSLSEHGMLLTTGARLLERGGSAGWLGRHRAALARVAGRLVDLARRDGPVALLHGSPEADEADRRARYFHNNAWVVRGLGDWAGVLAGRLGRREEAKALRVTAGQLRLVLLDAIHACWPADPADWWLTPAVEPLEDLGAERPRGRVTAGRFGSYTNYRYWPELLSSGVLPRAWAERIVRARLTGGGQFCGATRFLDRLDDWPLAEHLDGLWRLGRRDDYRLCLWGHVFYHQGRGHLTAYEQVTLPPGRKVAEYCLPCQLVAVRAARRLV